MEGYASAENCGSSPTRGGAVPAGTMRASTRNVSSAVLPSQGLAGAGGGDLGAAVTDGAWFPMRLGRRFGFVPPRPRVSREGSIGGSEEEDGERVGHATAPHRSGDRTREWKRYRERSGAHVGRRGHGAEERQRQRRRRERLFALLLRLRVETARLEAMHKARQVRLLLRDWAKQVIVDRWEEEKRCAAEIDRVQHGLMRLREQQLEATQANLAVIQAEVEEKANQLIIFDPVQKAETCLGEDGGAQRIGQVGRLRMEDVEGTMERLGAALSIVGCATRSPFFKQRIGGYVLYGYSDATLMDFQGAQEDVQCKAECRGVVFDLGAGKVVARPLHKFWTVGQLRGNKLTENLGKPGLGQVVEATEKLDGAMVYAVPVGDTFELWTRNGPTHHGNIAKRWAVEQGAFRDSRNFMGLFVECEHSNATPIFEWLGPQVGGKVRHKENRLVLTQVRHKVTGEYWLGPKREGIAQRYNIEVAARHARFEGKSIKAVGKLVQPLQELEGLVLRMTSGHFVKMKTQWWQQANMQVYQRWPTETQRREAQIRQLRKMEKMELRELRALVKQWPGEQSPSHVLKMFPTASKVEARWTREGGKRGAIIVSFSEQELLQEAMSSGGRQGVHLEQAYSLRTSSNHRYRVQTWYADRYRTRLPHKPSSSLTTIASTVLVGMKKGAMKRFQEDCAAALQDNDRYDSELAQHLASLLLEARQKEMQSDEGYADLWMQGQLSGRCNQTEFRPLKPDFWEARAKEPAAENPIEHEYDYAGRYEECGYHDYDDY